MKTLILSTLLLLSFACRSQVYLGPGYKNMPPETFLMADPCLTQVLYNDTFMVSTRSITGNCNQSIQQIIAEESGEVLVLSDSIYISIDRKISLATIYVTSNNTLIRIQTRSNYKYMLSDKMVAVLNEVRRHSYSTLLASN